MMKRGPYLLHLEIDPGQPLIFKVKTPPGAVLRVVLGLARNPTVHAPGAQARLTPCLVWDADVSVAPEQYVERALVLLPPDGWLGDDRGRCIGHFVSMIDGCPFLVYEVPPEALTERDDDAPEPERTGRPVIDVPSVGIGDLAPLEDDDLPDPGELH